MGFHDPTLERSQATYEHDKAIRGKFDGCDIQSHVMEYLQSNVD